MFKTITITTTRPEGDTVNTATLDGRSSNDSEIRTIRGSASHHHTTVRTKRTLTISPLRLRPTVHTLLTFTLLLGIVSASYNNKRSCRKDPRGFNEFCEDCLSLNGITVEVTSRPSLNDLPNISDDESWKKHARYDEPEVRSMAPRGGFKLDPSTSHLGNCDGCDGTGKTPGLIWGTNECEQCNGTGNCKFNKGRFNVDDKIITRKGSLGTIYEWSQTTKKQRGQAEGKFTWKVKMDQGGYKRFDAKYLRWNRDRYGRRLAAETATSSHRRRLCKHRYGRLESKCDDCKSGKSYKCNTCLDDGGYCPLPNCPKNQRLRNSSNTQSSNRGRRSESKRSCRKDPRGFNEFCEDCLSLNGITVEVTSRPSLNDLPNISDDESWKNHDRYGEPEVTSRMMGLDKIPLYECKTCDGSGNVRGWFGGTSRCSECGRRRLQDDVNPLAAEAPTPSHRRRRRTLRCDHFYDKSKCPKCKKQCSYCGLRKDAPKVVNLGYSGFVGARSPDCLISPTRKHAWAPMYELNPEKYELFEFNQGRKKLGIEDKSCNYTMRDNVTCEKCGGDGTVPGMIFGTNPCPKCQGKGSRTIINKDPFRSLYRRRLEDDVNPLTALCAWALMLLIVALVYIVDRQMKMQKRDALQAGRFNRTATM